MAVLTTVFVYGTLMPGERNAHVAFQAAQSHPYVTPATLPGYQLLHLHPEGYPAVIAGTPSQQVSGYTLTYTPADWQTVLPFLDELEGLHETPPLYTRQQVTVQLQEGLTQAAWVYLYAHPTRLQQPGVSQVHSGDWREVQVQQRQTRGPDER